jgi:uncharacterized membrane protein
MNTLTPQPRSTEENSNQDWLNFASLKDASLVAGGVGLAMFGLVRRSPFALIAGGVGAWLAAKTANDWIAREEGDLDVNAISKLEEVSRAITIQAPLHDVFDTVGDVSRVPQFLPIVKLVNMVSYSQAIWTMKSGMLSAMLDVEITRTEDSQLKLIFTHNGKHLGEANIFLTSVQEGRSTRVTMRMRYHPLLGGLVSGVVKPVMTAELDTFLQRLKQFMETGEIARSK